MQCFRHILKRVEIEALTLGVVELAVDLTEVVVVVLFRGTYDPTLKILPNSSLIIVSTPHPAVQLRSMQGFKMGHKKILCKPSRVSRSMTMTFLFALATE